MSEPDQPYIREMREGDEACRFKCGEHLLDQFFRQYALGNHNVGDCKAYVLVQTTEPRIIGYYTLSPSTVESHLIAERLQPWRAPRQVVPAFLLGRLAVQKSLRGNGYGSKLLHHALRMAAGAAGVVGGVGLIVDAKNEKAVSFYGDYGLALLDGVDYPRRMFIRMTDLRAAIAAAQQPL